MTAEVTALHKLVCDRCKKPITKGQRYANVRLPEGTTAPVHGKCLEPDPGRPAG